ncbi:MAG: D-aminoacylase [Gemmatimonadota bacterium]|nr:D-aminoacylase [Gemmatimonadota bacterium]
MRLPPIFALTLLASLGCGGPTYDVVIRGGTVYNGSDSAGIVADVAIQGDSIVAVGNLGAARGRQVIDAQGLAVAPGFINMLSWANEALLVDGKSQSDIRQGVTLEIFGEGESMGPLTPAMKAEWEAAQGDIRFPITWTTLAGYLDTLVHRGVSPNVASFVGAATVRQYVLGHDPRQATKSELAQMQQLVGEAMADGALGVGSSLIYEPGMFATSTELEWLAQIAAARGGIYISHIRNEGDSLFEALDEFLGIAARAGARAEIYHLKTSGPRNWDKEDELLTRIEEARSKGLKVTADMYTYPASATGLDAVMPGWVRAGGFAAWAGRLQDPATRRRLKPEVTAALVKVGGADHVLLVGFKNDSLKHYTGQTLAQVATTRGTGPEETAMDLVYQDNSRIGCVYFSMSEENVRKQIQVPWISFGSDEASLAPEGVFLKSNPHPRAYGTFARLLGKYVRDEKLIRLEQAIHRLTLLPATTLRLKRRGALRPGYFADVVIFDPATIQDHATFEKPHQYSTGVRDVFVNGTQVLKDGEHTGATPGRVVRGAGVP